MPTKIIKDATIVDDNWQLLEKDSNSIPEGAVIVPLAIWQSEKEQLSGREQIGVWLDSDESPSLIADELEHFQLIAVNFPAFADGRGFSYGRELREKHGYTGEIRAIGQFMRDQLYYLQRCGFNAFELNGFELEPALNSLKDFSESYQAGIDQPTPLFRRR